MKNVSGGKRLCVFALAICLICGLIFTSPSPVIALTDDNMYTIVLSYDDNIQLTYQHLTDGYLETTTGDVPVGGAYLDYGGPNQKLALAQVYCAAASVPFHSRVGSVGGGTTWSGGLTIDTAPNYAAVVPEQVPAVLGAHWRELEWVVLNGYQGTPASLTAMNNLFPNLIDNGLNLPDFDKDVAVMATKAAVWHFTNPDVVFTNTGFLSKSAGNPNSSYGIKHRQFIALLDALIKGADNYAIDPGAPSLYNKSVDVTPYDIVIDDSDSEPLISVGTKPTNSSFDEGGHAFGPYYVRETQDSFDARPADTVRTRETALLQLFDAGTLITDVEFYDRNPGDTSAQRLSDDPVYGESSSLPGVGISDPTKNGADVPFYVFVPQSKWNDISDDLTITAVAKEDLLSVNSRTVKIPKVLAYQDPQTGVQDWNKIQAFIGVADAPLTQYASALIPYGAYTTSRGAISVTKFAAVGEGPFKFQITDGDGNPVLLNEKNFHVYTSPKSEGFILDGMEGTFCLAKDMTEIWVENLPFGQYKVKEFFSEAYSVSWAVGSPGYSGFTDGDTASVTLSSNPGEIYRSVMFSNEAVPFNFSVAKVNAAPLGEMSAPLQDVEFRLEEVKGDVNYVKTMKSDLQGSLIFNVPLPKGTGPTVPSSTTGSAIYELTETQAADDYNKLSGPITIRVQSGIITDVAVTSGDEDLVSISGLNTRFLRLMIANVLSSPEIPQVPDKPEKPVVPDKPTGPESPGVPKTGDDSDISGWLLCGGGAFVLLVVLSAMLVYNRRTSKRKN
jgi:hypothetical protein